MNFLFVGIGGFLGAVSRYSVYQGVNRFLPSAFPYATLLVNTMGSFCLGLLAAWLAHNSMPEKFSLLIGVGFLGAFTTFSTYSMDLVNLYKSGHVVLCAVNLLINPIFAVFAAALGLKIFS